VTDPPRKPPPNPLELLRDRRAIVDTGLGPVAFVGVNAVAGLETAAVVAVAISVFVAVFRALRRAPLTNAIGGILGTGLAVFIALRTGSASGYFVPRAIQNAGLALAMGGSALIGRPLVGYIVALLYGRPLGWVREPRVRRVFTVVSLAFAALFAIRAVIYTVLILAGREGALAGAVIVLGWPGFLAVIFFAYRYVPARLPELRGAGDQPPAPTPSPGDTRT
jgi:hypothetical protein